VAVGLKFHGGMVDISFMTGGLLTIIVENDKALTVARALRSIMGWKERKGYVLQRSDETK